MTIDTHPAPRLPHLEHQSVIQWIGHHQGHVLDGIDPSLVGAVAMSLWQIPNNLAARRRVRNELGLGLVGDLQAWRRQLDLDHPQRRAWDGGPRPYRPGARLLNATRAESVAAAAIEAELAVDPTIFLTPGHHVTDELVQPARQNDLSIAEQFVSIIDRRGLREPNPSDDFGLRRQVYATLLVDAQRLSPRAARWLIDAYAGLPVDGIWVVAVNFNKGKGQALLLLEFIEALQERTRRPVVANGLWHWHLTALARGVAATCVGPHHLTVELPPKKPIPTTDGVEPGLRMAVHIYHRPILGNFGLGEADIAKAQRAFARWPCPCGFHAEGVAPMTTAERRGHNQWALMQEAREAIGDRHLARMGQRVRLAADERRVLGMSRPGCWSATLALEDAGEQFG